MTEFCPPLNPDIPLHVLAPELVDVFEKAGFNTHGIAAHLGPQATGLYTVASLLQWRSRPGRTQMDLLIRLFCCMSPCRLQN